MAIRHPAIASKAAKAAKGDKKFLHEAEVFRALAEHLNAGKSARTFDCGPEDRAIVETADLLSLKPIIYAANMDEDGFAHYEDNKYFQSVRDLAAREGAQVLPICAKLEQDIAERDDLTQPEKLVMSSERFVKHFEDRGFTNIVLSAKAHSVQTTLDTYRALSREIPHVPLHLGVTEAGTKLQGTIKSSVGLGILLSDGIAATMRVSLTANPVEEPPVAWGILQSLGLRRHGPEIVSCPTCARCQVNLIPIAEEVTERLKNYSAPLSIAVMGCAVNGPGEASDADLGVACGRGQALLFSHGQIIGKVAEDQIVDALMAEVDKLIEEK